MRKTRYRTRRVRGDSRTIPKAGATGIGFGQDDDGWYSCWHCGFTCNENRESLGGSQSQNNVNTRSYQDAPGKMSDDPLSVVIVAGGVPSSVVLMELGADGTTAREIYNGVVSEPEQGCPLCGSLNWRGDF